MLRDSYLLRRFHSLSEAPGLIHAYAAADAFGGYDATHESDRERLRAHLEGATPLRLVRTRQTHSARVARIEREGDGFRSDLEFDESGVDGLVTTTPGLLLHAISADCPLLFLATESTRAVAIAHCGWRGVAGGIVEHVVSRLCAAGGVDARAIRFAAVSPGAAQCCYEVGEEVIDAIVARGVDRNAFVVPYSRPEGTPTRAISLSTAITALLARSGVEPGIVERAEECTICGGESFHSHRRRGKNAGRMSGVIAL